MLNTAIYFIYENKRTHMKVTLYCQFSKLSVFKSDTGNEMSGRYSQSTTEIKSRKPGKYNQSTTETKSRSQGNTVYN